MATFIRSVFPIAKFIQWADKNQLILQPKFQRRPIWEPAARSYLIDTIVRDLPMPKVYIRRAVNPETNLMAYEVVDGQQRLRAILDFYAGSLILSKVHNPELGDSTFPLLSDPVQRAFLSYEVSTEVMQNATDEEVWAMFERLNTYTLTLNRQEKLNAKWFGYFKQTAYELAAEKSALDAWHSMRVFSDRQIARMREVELSSDILVAIVSGISDITDIAKLYAKHDRRFPSRRKAAQVFRSSLAWLSQELGPTVGSTSFRNLAWFYSLFVAIVDAKVGIPRGMGPTRLQSGARIAARMIALSQALSVPEPKRRLARLKSALSRATSHVPERSVRHRWFYRMLTASDIEWRQYVER